MVPQACLLDYDGTSFPERRQSVALRERVEPMPSSHKKVIVRRFTGDLLCGYLAASHFLEASVGDKHAMNDDSWALHLLDLSGRVIPVRLGEIKMVCYVRDFNLSDVKDPERLVRRSFLARPRGEGLWVRVTFRSGDLLEGLAPTDLALADDLMTDRGLQLIPPDTRANTQRIYIPRSALSELQVLAVVTSRTRQPPAPKTNVQAEIQEELFRPASAPGRAQEQEQ